MNEFSDVTDTRVLWDLIKYRIRQVTIKYSKEIARNRRTKLKECEEKVKSCEEICNHNLSEENIARLDEAKSEYETLYDHIIQGRLIRSRANWCEYGEKNSKYFLNLENTNSKRISIRRIFDDKGKLMTGSHAILKELEDFYNTLYSNQDFEGVEHWKANFLNDDQIPKLRDELQMICEGVLLNNECLQALSKLPNGKSPGEDGLTAEFYKKFWPLLGQLMTDCFNFSYERGELSNSQRNGIIRLIEKKGEDLDRRCVKNWRPISLLNVDTKIVSKVFAMRLEKVLSHVINGDQYAHVKGRSIFDAVRSIGDIMDYTMINQLPGVMVAVDFEKAFDSISLNFLLEALRSFNFGPSFIKWVSVFYSNISSCVINNGFSTPLFPVERGVRQGDPLSPYLFILALEVLLINIRSDPSINGIKTGDTTKIIAFSDDLTTFVQDNNSLEHVFGKLKTFEIFSNFLKKLIMKKRKPIGLAVVIPVRLLYLEYLR